jgi:hypothetical protein
MHALPGGCEQVGQSSYEAQFTARFRPACGLVNAAPSRFVQATPSGTAHKPHFAYLLQSVFFMHPS